MRKQRRQWFPRVLGWLTLGYGAYTLARPQSLVHAAGLAPRPGPVSPRARLLGTAIGARDLISGLAMVSALPGTPLRVAVAARVACDAGDVIGLGGAATTFARWLGAAVRGVVPRRRATTMTNPSGRRAGHHAGHHAGHRDVGPSVAVVGAGISGLTAAYLLSRTHAVTLYEAEPRLGGHAHTHDVTDPAGARLAVDTGFIVHNDRTYPLLRRLFAELGVHARPSEMSMSIHDEGTGLQYAGGRGARGVFAQRRRAGDPRFWSVLAQVRRFHRRARAFLARTDDGDDTTYGEFLRAGTFTAAFVRLYAVPVVSCVWSMGSAAALEYPARYLLRFLDHHGMLGVTGSPRWHTVVGGSRTYVDAVAARVPQVRAGRPVTTVLRDLDGVSVRDAAGAWERYDRVVVATHADQALRLLADPTPEEKEVLGAFGYSRNDTVLHTDASLLPPAPQARACWNYLVPAAREHDRPPVVTYWMNRLQGLDSAAQYLVTLNATERIDPGRVVARMTYEHPVYDAEAVRAQRRLADLASATTVYAGAYHGWGFHEDGCRSGVEAARRFGVTW